MNFNPYEELSIFLASRETYLQQILLKLENFKLDVIRTNALPRTITIDALVSNHLCCSNTLEQLKGMVNHVCSMPLTPDTNMATYDLHNRLLNWTMIYKANVEDKIDLEISFLNGSLV